MEGAALIVSSERVPCTHCSFYVQYVQRPQLLRDGEENFAFTVVICEVGTVPQLELRHLSGF